MEGDVQRRRFRNTDGISIHALRVEGDQGPRTPETARVISIHALRVEGDRMRRRPDEKPKKFLSTPSGWRATAPLEICITVLAFLSTPSGWRATFARIDSGLPANQFLSTPSGWRATSGNTDFIQHVRISIHALRVEGDPPVAKRPLADLISIHALRVEGDGCMRFKDLQAKISIHALRVEGDFSSVAQRALALIFLSTPSGWRATQTHRAGEYRVWHFYPRPPGGGRHRDIVTVIDRRDFYPRPPGGGRHVPKAN